MSVSLYVYIRQLITFTSFVIQRNLLPKESQFEWALKVKLISNQCDCIDNGNKGGTERERRREREETRA